MLVLLVQFQVGFWTDLEARAGGMWLWVPLYSLKERYQAAT